MPNTLLFRTPIGGQTLPPGTTAILTGALSNFAINVSPFSPIRIAGAPRLGSPGVTFLFVINESGEFVTLLDQPITLASGQSFSASYDVPGTGLTIIAVPSTGVPSTIDLVVYGFSAAV